MGNSGVFRSFQKESEERKRGGSGSAYAYLFAAPKMEANKDIAQFLRGGRDLIFLEPLRLYPRASQAYSVVCPALSVPLVYGCQGLLLALYQVGLEECPYNIREIVSIAQQEKDVFKGFSHGRSYAYASEISDTYSQSLNRQRWSSGKVNGQESTDRGLVMR